jgi:hypothetical protein
MRVAAVVRVLVGMGFFVGMGFIVGMGVPVSGLGRLARTELADSDVIGHLEHGHLVVVGLMDRLEPTLFQAEAIAHQ